MPSTREELPPTPETEEVEHDLEAVSSDAEETEVEAVDEDDGDGRLQLQREALDEKRALGDVHRPTPDPWQGPTPDPWDPGSDDPQSVDGSK